MKRALPHTRSCFVCGLDNHSGLKLDFHADGAMVTAKYIPKPEHTGFKDTVHGGITSTILDEIMVWACGVQARRFAFCAELNVRFLKPLRPGQDYTVSAGIITNRKNRLFETTGEIRDSHGELMAASTGKYIPIKDTDQALLMAEFVEDASLIFESATNAGSPG